MYVDFDTLPDNARVWVYQASRLLTQHETEVVRTALEESLNQWAAHGQALLASLKIIENRFIIIGVDEGFHVPSGCSIDASVRSLQEIGQQVSSQSNVAINFFDRSVAVLDVDGHVQTYALPTLKKAVADGFITPETTVFNTLVASKAEFSATWQTRAIDSWLKRYFEAKPVTTT